MAAPCSSGALIDLPELLTAPVAKLGQRRDSGLGGEPSRPGGVGLYPSPTFWMTVWRVSAFTRKGLFYVNMGFGIQRPAKSYPNEPRKRIYMDEGPVQL